MTGIHFNPISHGLSEVSRVTGGGYIAPPLKCSQGTFGGKNFFRTQSPIYDELIDTKNQVQITFLVVAIAN